MNAQPPRPHRARLVLLLLAAAAVVIAALGVASRVRARAALRDRTLAAAAPMVNVIRPVAGDPGDELALPGNVEAFTEAPIYARTNGYVKAWYADIGTVVAKGQKLADIESPEVDQQLKQARADLQTTAANEELARITADRLSKLVGSHAVSQQEYDNAASAYAARRAETASAKANVGRLEQLVGFERIVAPFAGTITARNTDVGQLIDSGSAGGPARELFRIASTDKLRVFVEVPEVDSAAAKAGVPVELTFAERPGKRYPGTIARSADAITPGTRTLRVEVDLDNPKGEILPGAYAQVHLKLENAAPALLVPVSALLFRAEGPRIATVVEGNKVALLPVVLGRDLGTQLEITSGLRSDAAVIDSPPDSILDGQVVRIASTTPPA
ncbi:MAG: efflux RND transporter periplasmic adaptor subunit [Thermoanaerobaculia bacterium]